MFIEDTRKILLMPLAVLLASCATGNCSRGSEFEPALCAVNLPPISSIDIHQNAARSTLADDATRCDDFVLTESQLYMFFSATRQIDAGDAHHQLDWSPCHASGDVRFSDGRVGQWTISQSRVGSLAVDGDEPVTLYCRRCQFAPFK